MTLDDDVDVTSLINGYVAKKGNVKTWVVLYDSPQDADLIMVIFKFTYNGEDDVSYNGYRVEIDLHSDGHKKSQGKREELKQDLLDAGNHRNGRYVELVTKSKFKVIANFVRRDGTDTEVFYSVGTTNMELSTTSGSLYEEFLNQVSAMSKDHLRKSKEYDEMRSEVQRMQEAMEELVSKSASFKYDSLRAFTKTMNEQKAEYSRVVEENEVLRGIIENAGLEAPARRTAASMSNGKVAKGSPLKSSGGRKSASPKITRMEEDEDDIYNQDTDVSSPDEVRSPSPPSRKKKTATPPARSTRQRKSVDAEEEMRDFPDVIPESEELPPVKVTQASKDDDDETDYDSQDLFKDDSQVLEEDDFLPVPTKRTKLAKHVFPFKKSPVKGDTSP